MDQQIQKVKTAILHKRQKKALKETEKLLKMDKKLDRKLDKCDKMMKKRK